MRLLRTILFLFLLVASFSAYTQDTDSDLDGLSIGDQIIIAADKGDTTAVSNLIGKGGSVNATTLEGVTSLMFASQNGNHEMVELLLKHGAKPDIKPSNGYTALILAIFNGHIQVAEDLIRNGANIDLPDNNNVTPLMHSVVVDSFYLPDLMLYYGASADQRDNRGTNALMLAAKYGRYEIAIKLMEAGMDVNSTDEEGNTALHYAASAGQADIMELLIVNGAEVDIKNSIGYTPLSIATALNDYKSARVLIGYGADVNCTITNSMNPLTLALDNKNDSLAGMLINNGAKAIQNLSFDLWSVGTRYTFNQEDSKLVFTLGLSDRKYNIMTGLGFGFRAKAVKVLEKTDQDVFYQYWEKRKYISVTVDKAFFLQGGKSGFTSGPFLGFSEVLTFGSYRGSDENPDTRLIINPRIGVIGEYGALRFKLGYEFMDLRLDGYNKGWFNISVELLLRPKKVNIKIP